MIPPNTVDELAPLPPVELKKLPAGMEAKDVLRIFLQILGEETPILQHLGDYGFDLDA